MSDAPAEPGHPLLLADGERGRAVAYAEGILHLVSERPHPPGQPLTFSLRLPDGAELALQGKSANSKLRHDGGFDVRLKLVSLRREQRAALEQLFGR